MIGNDTSIWLIAAAALLGGLGFGLVYFAGLRRAVAAYVGDRGWQGPVTFTLARLGAAILVFGLAAKLGALALLATFLGFLAARAGALRGARERT